MHDHLHLIIIIAIGGAGAPAAAATYYVSPSGSNSAAGTAAAPWATPGYALNRVAGGDTIIVEDGLYDGAIALYRSLSDWVTLKAENPYRAKLTDIASGTAAPVFRIYVTGSAKLVVDGFIISNLDPAYVCGSREGSYTIHIQDAQDVIFRNNIIYANSAHGGCNEVVKVNRSGSHYTRNIQIAGNVLSDPANADGSDIIDSMGPGELDIVDNIFFSRYRTTNSQSLSRPAAGRFPPRRPRPPRHQPRVAARPPAPPRPSEFDIPRLACRLS